MASLSVRYASALLGAAVDSKSLEQVSEEVTFFQHLYQENEDFKLFLNSPEIDRNQKIRVLQTLFRERLSNTFSSFLLILLKNHRQDTFPEIASKFKSLYNQYHNRLQAHVTTVVPLTEEQTHSLRSKLNKISGAEVQITNEVDPSILGGIIIKMDSQWIDGSVKFQLKKLKEHLLAASK